MAGEKKIWNYLLRVLGFAVFLVLLILLAASLILARPQKEKAEISSAQPYREAGSSLSIDSETDLFTLISEFPVPVMNFMSGSGMTFVSAVSADEAIPGGFARVATLNWQTADGQPMILRSICPDTALSLLDGEYHFMPYAGPTLFGRSSVRMENDETIRLHVAKDGALYVVLLPRSLSGQVSALCRSLQLYMPPVSRTDE